MNMRIPTWTCLLLGAGWAQAATPVPMASQPGLAYAETFGDIANWAADFSSGAGANRFSPLPAGGAGTIPSATLLTTASTNWASGSTGGKQKGSGALLLLSTGKSDNTTSVAVDFFMDFSGVDAGTLGFDWATVDNPTGDRKSSLRVYASVDGASFAELAAAQVLNFQNGTVAGGTVAGVALPASFHNCATARLRFYYHNGIGGTTGNRPKLSLDNLAVTARAAGGNYPTVSITNPATANLEVDFATSNAVVAGVAGTNTTGQLGWTNGLTGEHGWIAAGTNWTLSAIRLAVGTNDVAVRGTNAAGDAAVARATVVRTPHVYFTVMAANLTDRSEADQFRYIATSERIFQGLRPDVVAIQEWLVTNASRRAYVDAVFGTDFDFTVESYSGADIPNGIISRWPIVASGEWADTQVAYRDFAWATIDLPGTQDLHVISVHLQSGSTTTDEATRKKEAAILTNQIRRANWPAADFIVVAGDFNVPSRSDDSLLTLSNVVGDSRQPADQAGDKDTNLTRGAPYDYVLPSHLLNARHATLTVGGIAFPEGMVFDSRIWNPPPAPIQTNDSAGTDMQHLAVMKKFILSTCADCDEDAMPDAWEIGNFGSVTAATAHSDWDGDGFPDAHEYLAGTQPTNRASSLHVKEPLAPTQGAHLVQWDSVPGKRYRILRSTNLLNGFAAIRTGIAADAPVNVFTDLPPQSPTLLYGIGLDP
ncbi:MAG: endonuclease/exonuclease/phosphatase family protein [Kiritimatiellia bacterium]